MLINDVTHTPSQDGPVFPPRRLPLLGKPLDEERRGGEFRHQHRLPNVVDHVALVFILSDSSQYEVGRGFAAVSTGDGRSRATDRHIVLSGSIKTGIFVAQPTYLTMGGFRKRDGTRLVWDGLGLVIAALIGLALFRYVGTLLFAVFVYYATRPLYRRLDRSIDHPNVTATITILFVIIPMVAVIGYVGVVALGELDRFLAESSLKMYRSAFQPYLRLAREGNIGRLRAVLGTGLSGSVAGTLAQGLPSALSRLSSIAGFVFSVLARFFLMLTVLFYLLRDDHNLRRWFYDSVDHDEGIVEYTTAVDSDLETVFVSNLAVIAVAAGVAAATYVGLNALASSGSVVATPVLLSVLIGIGTLIPAVGMKIVYVPYGLLLLGLAVTTATPLWHPIAFLAISFVVVDTVPDFFARSLLSARSGVHMGLILLGYFLGTLAFGWYGLFLGPIVVVLAVHFAHMIFPSLVSDLLT